MSWQTTLGLRPIVGFADEAIDRRALHALLFIQLLEDLVEPQDLIFGFLKVLPAVLGKTRRTE
jgi:hypothetical protein